MAKLTCDYNFAASKNLLGGISEEDLQAYKKKAALGYERLQVMVDDGKVGFPHLPKYDTNGDEVEYIVDEKAPTKTL